MCERTRLSVCTCMQPQNVYEGTWLLGLRGESVHAVSGLRVVLPTHNLQYMPGRQNFRWFFQSTTYCTVRAASVLPVVFIAAHRDQNN